MPVRAEAEPIIASAVVVAPPVVVALASSEMLTEEENDALNQISQRYLTLLTRTTLIFLDQLSVLYADLDFLFFLFL